MINSIVPNRTAIRCSALQPQSARSRSDAPPADQFQWSKALALPAYTFSAGAAGLSSLTAFANRFPAGGFTINPDGIVLNPEWTGHFAPGTVFHTAQPLMAAFSAGICLVRGGLELREGMKSGSSLRQLAGVLDLGLAATSLCQIASPGLGGVASLALIAARAALEVHQ